MFLPKRECGVFKIGIFKGVLHTVPCSAKTLYRAGIEKTNI
jgi:hypothetical protein